MPTYEYECTQCGGRFERRQGINDAPVNECPECNGKVVRVISGGAGFIMKGNNSEIKQRSEGCSLEQHGKTCCGRTERCGKPPCGSGS